MVSDHCGLFLLRDDLIERKWVIGEFILFLYLFMNCMLQIKTLLQGKKTFLWILQDKSLLLYLFIWNKCMGYFYDNRNIYPMYFLSHKMVRKKCPILFKFVPLLLPYMGTMSHMAFCPSKSLLVQVMNCGLLNTKTLSEVKMTYKEKVQHNLNKNIKFSSTKYIWKCHLQNLIHFVPPSMYNWIRKFDVWTPYPRGSTPLPPPKFFFPTPGRCHYATMS